MIIIIHFKCWCWEETSCFYQQPWEGPWQSPGQMLERRWRCYRCYVFSDKHCKHYHCTSLPRCTSHPHNSIVNSSRRSFGTIKIAVPSSIIYFAFETNVFVFFNIHNFGGESTPVGSGVLHKCPNFRRLLQMLWISFNVKIGEDQKV